MKPGSVTSAGGSASETSGAAAGRSRRDGAVLAVLAVALVLRVAWALVVPVVPVSDSAAYDNFARRLAAGGGYGMADGQPSAYWPVGTAAVYAALYTVFGVHYEPIVVLNVLLGLATTWLVMATTRDWFGRRAALMAGLITAFWPVQVQFTTILASELFFNVFVLLAIYLENRQGGSGAIRATATGVSVAAASYFRPLALPMPALFWLRRLIDPQERRRGLVANTLAAGVMVGVMAGLIAPWAIRNDRAFGQPVLISTNGGANFWMGNNPESDGRYMPLPAWTEALTNEAERDKALKQAAWKYIRENPGGFVEGLFRKVYLTYSRETIGVVWNARGIEQVAGSGALRPLKLVSSVYFAGALLLALIGAVAALRGRGLFRWAVLPPVMFWAFFAAVHVLIVGGDRYHYPSLPMMASLGGLALAALAGGLEPRSGEGLARPVGAGAEG